MMGFVAALGANSLLNMTSETHAAWQMAYDEDPSFPSTDGAAISLSVRIQSGLKDAAEPAHGHISCHVRPW